jgi:NADH dehydrogenase FAD-containing subunit
MKINVPESSLPRVIIVGGGFGGIMLTSHIKVTKALWLLSGATVL